MFRKFIQFTSLLQLLLSILENTGIIVDIQLEVVKVYFSTKLIKMKEKLLLCCNSVIFTNRKFIKGLNIVNQFTIFILSSIHTEIRK